MFVDAQTEVRTAFKMEEKSRKRPAEHDSEHTLADHPPRIHVHYEDPEHVHKRRRNERKIRQETAWLYHESPVPSPPDASGHGGAAVGAREDTKEDLSQVHGADNGAEDDSNVEEPAQESHDQGINTSNDAAEEDIAESDSDSDSSCESTPDMLSDISSISEGEQAWRPVAGPISWVQRQMALGQSPQVILTQLLPDGTSVPDNVPDFYLWKVIVNLLSEPPRRKKLDHVNTFDDVIGLIKNCKNIMVLTGAGVSVSCGIPDFRSRDGIYARLAVDYPDLPDPQAMFDIHYFKNNQRPFFQFAREIYPGQFQPSISHRFIQQIESHGKLLRNYTQNIDTLEQVAGIKNVVQCHGSFATATCMACHHKVDSEDIKPDIFNQVVPRCPKCPAEEETAIMKPDIVFFGESLPESFHQQMAEDKDHCDLLIVVGSSLKVRPVALIPSSVDAQVPQILINREPLGHLNFDVELLGDCDIIISEICRRLGAGWTEHLPEETSLLTECCVSDLSLPPQVKELPGESEPVTSADSGATSAEHVETSEATSSGQQESEQKEASPEEASPEEVSPEEASSTTWDGSLASYLKEKTYVHVPPCRYVFEGAEVFCGDGDNVSDGHSDIISIHDDDYMMSDNEVDMPDSHGEAGEAGRSSPTPSGEIDGGAISSTLSESEQVLTSTSQDLNRESNVAAPLVDEDNECSSSTAVTGSRDNCNHDDDEPQGDVSTTAD